MADRNVLSRFYELCRLATDAENAHLIRTVEPEYIRVLEFILDNPSLRQQIGETLLNLVEFPGQISSDLVEYCMHELRWPEVMTVAAERLEEAKDPREERVFECILEAYREDWNADGYFTRWSSR